jgi:hypothetical protein
MRLVSERVPSMPQGLNNEDIERILRSHLEDIRQLAMGEKGVLVNTTDVSSAYTILLDDDVLLCWGDTTITLLAADDVTGKMYWIKDISTNEVTVDSSTQVDDATRVNLDASQAICIASDGAEWRIVSGYQI